jgi:hypothetical protein
VEADRDVHCLPAADRDFSGAVTTSVFGKDATAAARAEADGLSFGPRTPRHGSVNTPSMPQIGIHAVSGPGIPPFFSRFGLVRSAPTSRAQPSVENSIVKGWPFSNIKKRPTGMLPSSGKTAGEAAGVAVAVGVGDGEGVGEAAGPPSPPPMGIKLRPTTATTSTAAAAIANLA